MNKLYQINFQHHFGGGEVYTLFLCQALRLLDISTFLFCHPAAKFWTPLHEPQSTTTTILIQIEPSISVILQQLGNTPQTVLTHGSIPMAWRMQIKEAGHFLVGIAHMPLYGRDQQAFHEYDLVIGVSSYVIESLKDAGLTKVYPQPWYGVATLERIAKGSTTAGVEKQSLFDWDKRKARDKVLSYLEPFYLPFVKKAGFEKRSGLTLGIVSRLTPIKQFPLLFSILVPILKKYPQVNIEIFGSGGYASVRDLKKVVQPLGQQVRFWGHQHNVALVYEELDFLLTGLPDKEALGLNVIEAQYIGLPVLAVNALPFTETVLDQQTGLLFTDPRLDQGQHFESLLQALLTHQQKKPVPQNYPRHLEKFSLSSFCQRVAQTLPFLRSN